jgi:ribose transport system substrate-binding protein
MPRESLPRLSRRDLLRLGALVGAGIPAPVLAACGSKSGTIDGPAASSAPSGDLVPFDKNQPAGPATDLPRRVAWASTSAAGFFLSLGSGMEDAAKERGLQYLFEFSGDDSAKNLRQLETFLSVGVGAVAFQPLNAAVQRPVFDAALRKGVCVQGIITQPSTLQVAASQYNIGYMQGKAAADFATARLQGNAKVHYFNLDSVSPQLKLRHTGVLAGLRTAGDGVRVVSDEDAPNISIDNGAAIMRTVIAEHPDIRIVLGGDTMVVGAFREMDGSGKLSNDMYFSGVDGEKEALALVKTGGPYRVSIAFAWRLMGYGLGQFAADWIEGKQIPRVMVAKPIFVDSPAGVDTYIADNANPAAVFADRHRYEDYLPLLGNVSYATRQTIWHTEYTPR